MDTQYLQNPFLNIPRRKLDDSVSDLLDSQSNDGILTTAGASLTTAFQRYYDANIPVDYWWRDMTDWSGPAILGKVYQDVTKDIKETYKNGERAFFAGKHGIGKQLDLETELPTPTGFIKLKDLCEGDSLFDENGNICKVLKLHPIQISPESYELEFDDGLKVNACADHLWLTHTRKSRLDKSAPEVRTTKEIFLTQKVNGKQKISNHSIECSRPINYSSKSLLIDPYVLGCWLGDGTCREGSIESADIEIIHNIELIGYEAFLKPSSVSSKSKSFLYRIGKLIPVGKFKRKTGRLAKELREFGLIQNKYIPWEYLHSSFEQRLALVQGLMDTDGHITDTGLCEFCSVIEPLARGFLQLILSFGIKATINKNKSFLNGKRCQDRYRVTFTTKLPICRITRKLQNIRLEKSQETRTTHRFITKVSIIDPRPMRCLTVDSPSHLFLITRNFIATHNTMVSCCILKRAVEKSYSALYVNLTDIIHIMLYSSPEVKSQAREILLSIDFLVIDEFDARFMGSENAADLFGRILEPIMRTRIQNKVPLFFCTNSVKVEESFSGPLRASIESLMKVVKLVPVIGGQDMRDMIKKGEL